MKTVEQLIFEKRFKDEEFDPNDYNDWAKENEYEAYTLCLAVAKQLQQHVVSSRSLIDKHQMCIEILEGIMHFEQRKKHMIESINGFAGTFPELRRKYVNDIDTINRCIKRLEQRYNRVLNGC